MDALIPPRLPGLLVRRPLGQGANPPWLAKADDGSWVVARRSSRPPDLPDHPTLLTVYGSVTDSDGAPWVITQYTSGSGLDRRLERVGQVGSSPATSWAGILASALAVLHAAGLAHGDLRPSRVLLGPRDTVLLDASCASAGNDEARAADVIALAELVEQAAGQTLDGPTVDVLRAAAAGDLDAGTLARQLGARAVRSRDRRAPARRASRGLLTVAAVIVLLAAAAGLGVRLAATPAQPAVLAAAESLPESSEIPDSSLGGLPAPEATYTTVAPTTEPAAVEDPDWTSVLVELDRARGVAFETADGALLADVDAPGSEALRRDRELVRALRTRHVTADGWATGLISVVPRLVATARAVLVVTDTRDAYVLRDSAGAVVDRQPARGPMTWVIRLVTSEAGWRISSVAEAPSESQP